MAAPAVPPMSKPMEHILWQKQKYLIRDLQTFKSGAFRGQFGWSATLWKGFKMLQDSPLLNRFEKKVVAADARTFLDLVKEEAQSGRKMTMDEMLKEMEVTTRGFIRMIDADAENPDHLKKMRSFMEEAQGGTICTAVIEAGEKVVIGKDNLDAFSDLPLDTIFIVTRPEGPGRGSGGTNDKKRKAKKAEKSGGEKQDGIHIVSMDDLEDWKKSPGAEWINEKKESDNDSEEAESNLEAKVENEKEVLEEAFRKNLQNMLL